MAEDTTGMLSDIYGRNLIPFEVEGQKFFVRQPTPDEYDDGEALKTLTYNKVIQQDYVQEVANLPCSQGEKALFQLVLKDTKERFDRLGDAENAFLKEQLAREMARLESDIASRTLAEEYASDKATLVRDRWLTMRLLCREDGRPVFNLLAKDFATRWALLSVKIKDAARPAIWRALQLVREAPFSLGH